MRLSSIAHCFYCCPRRLITLLVVGVAVLLGGCAVYPAPAVAWADGVPYSAAPTLFAPAPAYAVAPYTTAPYAPYFVGPPVTLDLWFGYSGGRSHGWGGHYHGRGDGHGHRHGGFQHGAGGHHR